MINCHVYADDLAYDAGMVRVDSRTSGTEFPHEAVEVWQQWDKDAVKFITTGKKVTDHNSRSHAMAHIIAQLGKAMDDDDSGSTTWGDGQINLLTERDGITYRTIFYTAAI